ncbi:MAG: UDP-N-acetylglucosamine--N-acetylmuramyl-(pentapeptide) pyrophosphoryl-undecaprenol N-acetylglucosamine transferase [Chloroflexi bacterium]|nr:MAG: UDP-N-acetylglucosamine--N-acetylmuramyl-(pentapeptide) pyrophosphoryl-undecaprenol N-acetylglucosamine transferase [Chloroflexota bacterium]
MRCLVSGGGTGGHIYPALAVVQALRDARPDLELSYLGGARGLEGRLVGARGDLPYDQLLVRSLRTAARDVHLVLDPMRVGLSVPQAWWLLGRRRPAAIFTTGGYLALPLTLAARARGIPTLVWEGNVIPGRSTRAVARVATRIAVSFPPTLDAFPGRSFVSGTPIRSFGGIAREAARERFGIAPDDRLLLVFGGSQAVTTLNSAVFGSLNRLLDRWRLLHVTGESGMGAALVAREQLPASLAERYQPQQFLTDGMADALVAADLVVGRAGSSTCAEVSAVGVASILVPYPHAGSHQRANAAWLGDHGAALVIADQELSADRLASEAERLRDDAMREPMAEAAHRLGRPDAARVIAKELLALADGRPLPSLADEAAA